jgi:hypothetical protein
MMTKPARSVLVFGIYLVVTGVVLYAAPNALLSLLRLPATSEPWIRVAGVPVGAMGALHIAAARGNDIPFFHATVWVRAIPMLAFGLLALLRVAPPILVAFGIVDVAAALWTRVALRAGAG